MDWKSTWKLEFQSNVFEDIRNKFVSAHCIVTSNVLTVTNENHKWCIFPILPVNVPRSYFNTSSNDFVLHDVNFFNMYIVFVFNGFIYRI